MVNFPDSLHWEFHFSCGWGGGVSGGGDRDGGGCARGDKGGGSSWGGVNRAIIRKKQGTQSFMYLLFNDSLMTLFLCFYRCMGIGKWISKSERGFFFWLMDIIILTFFIIIKSAMRYMVEWGSRIPGSAGMGDCLLTRVPRELLSSEYFMTWSMGIQSDGKIHTKKDGLWRNFTKDTNNTEEQNLCNQGIPVFVSKKAAMLNLSLPPCLVVRAWSRRLKFPDRWGPEGT